MGFLYVDGHVRAYHGQRAISSNAYVARRHLAMPASTDYRPQSTMRVVIAESRRSSSGARGRRERQAEL
jgi:hypothetical protein